MCKWRSVYGAIVREVRHDSASVSAHLTREAQLASFHRLHSRRAEAVLHDVKAQARIVHLSFVDHLIPAPQNCTLRLVVSEHTTHLVAEHAYNRV